MEFKTYYIDLYNKGTGEFVQTVKTRRPSPFWAIGHAKELFPLCNCEINERLTKEAQEKERK